MVINALNPGFPTPRSTDAALERPAATGQYYLNASQSSTSSPTTQNKRVFPGSLSRTSGADLVSDSAMFTSLAGPSNKDSTIRPNATQMKSALVEAPSRTAAGRAQKNGKGGMDPV